MDAFEKRLKEEIKTCKAKMIVLNRANYFYYDGQKDAFRSVSEWYGAFKRGEKI